MEKKRISFLLYPFLLAKSYLYKNIIGPLIYRKRDDYDAERFWRDRFTRYHLSLRGAGNVNLTEEENRNMYKNSAKIILDLLKKINIDIVSAKVLEVGCGTGFYARLLYDHGLKDYCGLDITDVLFSALKEILPSYKFVKGDITKEGIEGSFDLILMINVTEHIVNPQKLSIAMRNVDKCLVDEGIFIVGAIMRESKRHLFYVRYWSIDDIKKRLPEYELLALEPFQNGYICAFKKIKLGA
ncbi:MAG: class I SAM-dependent methyltransferase [candidate division WOR-3 bacterium]